MKDRDNSDVKSLLGPKRTPKQIEFDNVFISHLWIRNMPIRQITIQLNSEREYNLSHQQIHSDLKNILIAWRMERDMYISEHVTLELQKLDRIEEEAWSEWERSKGGIRRTVLQMDVEIIHTQDTFGNPRYLNQIQKCIERRSALLGLDAPKAVTPPELSPIMQMNKEELSQKINELRDAKQSRRSRT